MQNYDDYRANGGHNKYILCARDTWLAAVCWKDENNVLSNTMYNSNTSKA